MAEVHPIRRLLREGPVEELRVGGRVCEVEAEEGGSRLLIADASGLISVATSATELSLGDWVVVRIACKERETFRAAVEAREPSRPPPPGSDWDHYHQRGRRRAKNLYERARVMEAVRSFFRARDFLEVETPLAVQSPGADVHVDAARIDLGAGPRWWTTSPEFQMKRLLAAGFPRIFQLARCARRNERGDLHAPEFTMLEWYRTFSSFQDLLNDTEHLVAHVARELHGESSITFRDRMIALGPPWPRITVEEAFETAARVSPAGMNEETFFRTWVDTIEPALAERGAVFVTHWPREMASNARIDPSNPRVSLRAESYVAGVELTNGFEELLDPDEQRSRFAEAHKIRAAQSREVYPTDPAFLRALEDGIPPCTGNALGLDRLVMLVTGATTIGDVLAVPETE